MASDVQICNRALQKLGAKTITSLSEDSVNARACNLAYDPVRLAELRAHPWACATTRIQLAADATTPAFGRNLSYTLPANFLRLLPLYPEYNVNNLDWIIEGFQIYTNDVAPLNVRYIYDLTDTRQMDPLFREAFSARLALEMCEALTQSNTKKQALSAEYTFAIREARRVNAIERRPAEAATDTYITARI